MNERDERTDVVIVGAGPAGSSLARRLARVGVRVVLLDAAQFPRAKPCGESLNPGAVAALVRLGIPLPASWEAARIQGWRISGAAASVTGRYPGHEPGLAWERARLDARLLEAAAEAGTDIRLGIRVERVLCAEGRVTGVATREAGGRRDELRAAIVVGADGLGSAVARSLGWGGKPSLRRRKAAFTAHVENIRGMAGLVEMTVGRGIVAGIAPLCQGRANVTVVVPAHDAGRAAGRKAAFLLETASRLPGLSERLEEARIDGDVLACGPFDRPVHTAAAAGAFLVGDAAGYYDPLTGQGIFRALRGAELAAPAVLAALSGPGDSPFVRYNRQLRLAFGPGTALQRLIDYGARHPVLFDGGLRLLNRSPALLSRLVAFVGDSPPHRAEASREAGDRAE